MISMASMAPVMGLVMNGVLGAYLMTRNLHRKVTEQFLGEFLSKVRLQAHLRWKAVQVRMTKMCFNPMTTKGLVTFLLPSDLWYSRKNVVVMHGVILKGKLSNPTVGPKANSIVHQIYCNYGPDEVERFLTEATWLFEMWMTYTNFSTDIHDFVPLVDGENRVIDPTRARVAEATANLAKFIESTEESATTSLEKHMAKIQCTDATSAIKDVGVNLAKEYMQNDNPLYVMGQPGAGCKGDWSKNGQMIGLVGQRAQGARGPCPISPGGSPITAQEAPTWRPGASLPTRTSKDCRSQICSTFSVAEGTASSTGRSRRRPQESCSGS